MLKLLRIIDANLNRSREGLRVCEDISRFVLNDKKITRSFKSLRHKISALSKNISSKEKKLLTSRNVKRDIGKKTGKRERVRKNIKSVYFANIQRVKESLRVLEEITKLLDKRVAESFKKIRFRVYELEKASREKVEAVLHN